ncbi:hypothetical protein O181_076128 [Austropuccinia psidii MF-1]|uniref:Reverse transcriptase Ty1/copia-type domain-containing protein n=1 Tax=Austropuccinia psidii MF-1 TaxID=1389203 RepID=A0A9Q3FEC2_9BASI|nr:hypothetical protein [Austropuccinia psidii MF-1]
MNSSVMSIQVKDIFDDSMIKMISSINMIYDPVSAAPIDYNTAINSVEGNDWSAAIGEELTSMNEQQIQGINFEETFVPTPTFTSLRLLFSISINKEWGIRTFDVKVAFLNSPIDKPVYVWPPRGMKLPTHSVLKLNKALYGTKQAARCWWLHLEHILKNIGFCINQEDTSTYYMDSELGRAMLWIHVDDGALMASSAALMSFISSRLDKVLRIKWDERVNNLVGISITPLADSFKFHQPDLILKLLNIIRRFMNKIRKKHRQKDL